MTPLFRPQSAEVVGDFMRKVQPNDLTIQNQIAETAKQVTKAIGATVSTVGTMPLALAEGGMYVSANILATPSAVLNTLGKVTNTVRSKTFNTLSGQQYGMAA